MLCAPGARPAVLRVISPAQPCNHASAARASARTHLPLSFPHPRLGRISPEQTEKNTNTTLAAPLAHTVNDPTCFRCRVGRFSEFEFRLPTRSNGPSITRIDGFGAKKTRKKLARWKQTILRAVLVSEAIMRCQFGYVMFFFKNNTKTKVLHVLDKVWIKSNLA